MTGRLSRLRWRPLVAGVLLGVVVGAVVGCGGDEAVIAVTATDGEELFSLRALGGEPGCATCHSQSPGVVLVGPSLADPAASASAAGGADVADYVRTSIIDPTDHQVPGFDDAKQMPTSFAEILTPAQVEALVDYLVGEAP